VSEETEKPPILTSSQSPKNSFRYLLWLALLLFVSATVWSLWVGGLQTKAEMAMYSDTSASYPTFGQGLSGILLMVASLSAFCLLVLGFVFCLIRRTQSFGIIILTCSLGFIGGCFGGSVSTELAFGSPRAEAFSKLQSRMTPLVNAIESYHRDTGAYPEELNRLVPKYLVKLPDTQMGKFTNYNYYVGRSEAKFCNNPWVIEIPCGFGIGFYQLYYFPLQNYPKGSSFDRYGKWAYFHE
jgi:hypothetical protein